jgi:diguanylate cyclase (GGDEF)-like protein
MNVTLSVIFVLAAIAISVAIGSVILFRAAGKIRNWFFLTMLATIIMLTGYLMELLSPDTEAAFQAVRVLYIGSQLVSPFALLFIADYCEIPLHRTYVRAPIVALGIIGIVLMWTTDVTGWLYKDYWLDTTDGNFLDFEPGFGYTIVHTIPAILLAICALFVLYRIKTWGAQYRKRLFLLFLVVLIPFMAEILYYLVRFTHATEYHLYFTPYSLALMDALLFFGIARYDFIEIKSVANERVMDAIAEAYILVDEQRRYVTSNVAAKLLFPGIQGMGTRFAVDSIPGWPSVLTWGERDEGRCHIEYETDTAGEPPDKQYFLAEINKVQASLVGTRTAWAVLIRDITAQKNMVKQLEGFAYLDPLTGLYNRRHFKELAQHEVLKAARRKMPYYVMMLDLDHFKRVNDTYGHPVGDAVLKTSAFSIKGALRVYDLLGRYGGEEFIILVTEVTKENAMMLAERIRADVEADYTSYGDKEIRVTISIGVAENAPGQTLEDVIEAADKALYVAKRDRNKVAFVEEEPETPEN